MAGSRAESRFWPEGGATERPSLHSSLPVSPAAETIVWPWAAACSNRRFSASWSPGSPTCASCSQTPQLDVTTWSRSLLTICEYSSRPPEVVFGASYTSMFAPGAIAETSSMSRVDSSFALPGPACVSPPSTGVTERRLPVSTPLFPDICAASVAPK